MEVLRTSGANAVDVWSASESARAMHAANAAAEAKAELDAAENRAQRASEAAMRALERMGFFGILYACLLYTSPSPRDRQKSRMPSSA